MVVIEFVAISSNCVLNCSTLLEPAFFIQRWPARTSFLINVCVKRITIIIRNTIINTANSRYSLDDNSLTEGSSIIQFFSDSNIHDPWRGLGFGLHGLQGVAVANASLVHLVNVHRSSRKQTFNSGVLRH